MQVYIYAGTIQDPAVVSTKHPTVPDCPTQHPSLTYPPEITPESIPGY